MAIGVSVTEGSAAHTIRPWLTRLVDLQLTSGWFAVRCLFRKNWPPTDPAFEGRRYEERITLWRASDVDEAIAKAEAEALDYAGIIEEAPDEYLGLAQAYALSDEPHSDGAEVFSLIRDSNLDPVDYLDVFFDTGREHQRGL